MPILAINTASSFTEIALISNDFSVVSETIWQSENNEAEKLMPEIQTLLNNNSYTFKDLEKIIVVSGPGSFTGLRIGVITANTLKYLLPVSLFSLNTFEYFWAKSKIESKKDTALLIYAGQKGLYYSEDEQNTKQENIVLVSNESIQSFLKNKKIKNIIGDFSKEQKELLKDFKIIEEKFSFAETIIKLLNEKKLENELEIAYPTYIKEPSITKSKNKLFNK